MTGCTALRDKVVLITGASSGIGASFARFFAEGGAYLVLTEYQRRGVAESA